MSETLKMTREQNQITLEQLIPILVKASYDAALNGILLEYLFLTGKGNKDQLDQFRKDAAQHIDERFIKANIVDQSLRVEQLNQVLNQLHQQIQSQDEMMIKYKENEEKYKQFLLKAKQINESSKQHNEQLLVWINNLIQFMKTNYSRFKTNEALIEEFTLQNPLPKGVKL